MHSTSFPVSAATRGELDYLNGKIVLVRSARDHRNPPTAMRGTIEIREVDHHPVVQVALDFPQMFTTRAHHRTIVLTDAEVERLLGSEREGTFDVTLDGPLDPEAPPGNG